MSVQKYLPFLFSENRDISVDLVFSKESGILAHNRIVPLLYERLKKKDLPSEEMKFLQNSYKSTVLKHLKTEGAFRALLPLLRQYGIEVICLKGIYLSSEVYPFPAARPMSDIDLLIHPSRIQEAYKIMIQAGAKEMYVNESEASIHFKYHLPALRFKGVSIELHYHIFPEIEGLKLPVEELWSHSRKVNVFGEPCLTFEPEYFLYHLCHHLKEQTQYGYIRLNWLLDLHYFLLKESDFNWNRFLELLNRTGAPANICEGLWVCHHLFGTKIPDILKEKCEDAEKLSIFYLSLCHEPDAEKIHIGAPQIIFKSKGFRRKFQFIASKIFPSRNFIIHTFRIQKSNGWFLYYPVLWFRYVVKGGRWIRWILQKAGR